MNERIEKFARECGAWNQIYGDKNFMIKETFDVEKFARLIVEECASRVRFTDLLECNDDSDGEILLQASVQLKQHFGVE
jgi:hypothetical protein